MIKSRINIQSLILLRVPPWLRWVVTIFVVCGAYILRAEVFDELPALPLLFFLPAILFSAIFSGAVFGLVATILSASLTAVFFLPPFGEFAINGSTAVLSLALFLLTGALITAMGAALRGVYLRTEELQRHTAAAYAEAEAARGIAEQGEKDRQLLLVEFEHRVKNDMQRVIATLSLQAVDSSPEAAQALYQACNQIKVIAAMHERLKHHAGEMSVEIGDYLGDLVSGFNTSLAGTRPVDLHANAHPCALPLDQASAVGLITNELITNALKHAFPGGRTGTICVAFVRKQDEFRLTLSDDGVGTISVSSGADGARSGIGRKLIKALAKQLGGELVTVANHPTGLSISLSFPAAVARIER
jgi:two-component sensor histidine kinase